MGFILIFLSIRFQIVPLDDLLVIMYFCTNVHNKYSKMKNKDKITKAELLYQVARLYYEDEFTQEQIAKETGFSRPKVQRLLSSARKEGIVQTHLVNPVSSRKEIEEKLEKHFTLTKAIVVSGSIRKESFIRKNIGKAAATYLENNLQDNDIVGIGWGRTVYETLNYFKPTRKISITTVPLIGGVGQVAADFQVNEMARRFAEKAGGTFVPFHVPALVDNEEIVNKLYSDRTIRKAVKLWEKVTIAVVGIGGSLSNSSYVPTSYYNDEDIASLKNEGHVGDLLSHFLRPDGKLCNPSLSKRIVGIPLKQLKKINQVIAVAGSLRKKEAILAALKEGYVDVLVTDENAARKILRNP